MEDQLGGMFFQQTHIQSETDFILGYHYGRRPGSKCMAIIESVTEMELHGFGGASDKTYGIYIYLRTVNFDGHV
jgi:hypothetical protein